jgi:hypothetical protein
MNLDDSQLRERRKQVLIHINQEGDGCHERKAISF